jgi:transposase
MVPLVERVDDIPLIIAYLKSKKIDFLFDKHIHNHGNQNNLSNGNVAIIWLSYILSQSDHRKSHVIDWVEKHQVTLSYCIGCQFDLNNFSDDRLARLLYKCALDKNWHPLETEIAKETLNLIPLDYMLEKYFNPNANLVIKGAFKLDSTSFTGHHEATEDGLMRYGFSNSNYEKLPQIKLMNCTDGFAGCSLVSTIASGNHNDESMYIPTLERMRKSFNTEGFLFCGDSKLSTKSVLDNLVKNKEFYLCPLQFSDKKNRDNFTIWVDKAVDGSQAIHQIYNGEVHYGFGYEFERKQLINNGDLEWIERVLVIKSQGYFEGEKTRFTKKLTQIEELLGKLKTKLLNIPEKALETINKDLEKIFENSSLPRELFEINLSIEEIIKTYKRSMRKGEYVIKKYRAYVNKLSINGEVLESLMARIGWRVFVTNISSNCLGFSEAYSYYRTSQYVIESGHHLFKSEPIGIAPLYVSRKDQLKGLIRFLSLGVLFLKLLSMEIMLRLKERKEELIGLTAGQPSRKTSTPTAKSILNYFCRSSISLIVFEANDIRRIQIEKPSLLCCKILELLNLSNMYLNIEKFNYRC